MFANLLSHKNFAHSKKMFALSKINETVYITLFFKSKFDTL